MGQTNSERQLIGRMQAGDSSAVGELASTYGPRIQQLAFRYVKNWEDAEEVTQDVLMKVYKKIDAFRGDAALSSWIYRSRSTRRCPGCEAAGWRGLPRFSRGQVAEGRTRNVAARARRLVGARRRSGVRVKCGRAWWMR